MKLFLLLEASNQDLEILSNYLRRRKLYHPAIDRIFQFARSGRAHRVPGGMGKEEEQLQKDQRLVAWVDKPLPGFDSLKVWHQGYLAFRPENIMIARFLSKIQPRFKSEDESTIIWDILIGLAFGYPPGEVRNFARDRDLNYKAMEYLKRKFRRLGVPDPGEKLDRHFNVIGGNVIELNVPPEEQEWMIPLLLQIGELVGPMSHPREYYLAVKIPQQIRSELESSYNFPSRSSFNIGSDGLGKLK